MPTYSTIQLENLIEPRVGDSSKKPLQLDRITPPPQKIEAQAADVKPLPVATTKHIYISPALYTTPDPAPVSGAPLSPSPYVVNHKRRGVWAGAVVNRRNDEIDIVPSAEMEERAESDFSQRLNGNLGVDRRLHSQGLDNVEAEDEGNEEEDEEYLDSKCEALSVGSANGSIGGFDCRSFVSAQGEYYDAIEDLSSHSSVPAMSSYTQSLESDLHAIRISLFEEIDRRKNAEETVYLMQRRWQKMSNHLCEAKLTCASSSSAKGDTLLEEVAQEVIVCKYVDEEIAKGLAHAEAELEAELILESKDKEISRLRDKLLYYEAVNCEMCQRNQEIVEHTRQKRLRKKSHKRWFWSCVGLSIVAGLSVVACSYLPQLDKHQEFPNRLSDDAPSSSSKAA